MIFQRIIPIVVTPLHAYGRHVSCFLVCGYLVFVDEESYVASCIYGLRKDPAGCPILQRAKASMP